MRKYLCMILGMLFSMQSIAQSTPATPPSQPTQASQPIPHVKNSDTLLSEKVQAAINGSTMLDGQAVSAASSEGVITLQGSVETKEQEKEAIIIAKSIPGVVDVTSQLTIKNSQ